MNIPDGKQQTFTEITPSGFEEVSDGYLIFLISENHYPLDNTQAREIVNSNRNIGVIKVSKDLTTIMTSGDKVEGGYFTYDR